MPQLETQHLGCIDYEPEHVVVFPAGLPAFEHETRFLVVEQSSTTPVVFLQSLQNPDLVFLTLPAGLVDPGYQLAPASDDLAAIGFEPDQPIEAESLIALAIVTISPDRKATANLMAPVLINRDRRLAVQALQPWSGYSHQHSLPVPAGDSSCS